MYLIATSAFGILFIFPVYVVCESSIVSKLTRIPRMFIDLLRKNALIGQVWLEGAWVGFFWVLNLGTWFQLDS